MARRSFGGTSADFLADSAGNVQDGGTGTVWTAQTGGTQITDLLTAGGSPTTTVTAAADGASPEGLVQFQGPDDGTAVVWVTFQDDASQRVKMVASDAHAVLGRVTNAEPILQGNNYDYVTTAFPNVGSDANTTVGIVSGGVYNDNSSGNIFQLSGYAENAGTRAVVGVLGEARGYHPFGANIIAYGTGTSPAPTAIVGTEIDFGNLSTATAASATGLSLNLLGGNVGGGQVSGGQYIIFASNDSLSQVPTGLFISAGTKQPIGDGTGVRFTGTLTSGSAVITGVSPTSGYSVGDYVVAQGVPAKAKIVSGVGTSSLTVSANATTSGAIADGGGLIFTSGTGSLIKATNAIVDTGLNLLSCDFATAAAWLPVSSGSTAQSFGIVLDAKGGFANGGDFINMRATDASSTVANGIRFIVTSGHQPIASTGSAISFGTITTAYGLNMSAATFTTAGIEMGDNNIRTGTTTGTKIASSTAQKLGFWGATPVAQQSIAAASTDLATVITLANDLRAKLRTLGVFA